MVNISFFKAWQNPEFYDNPFRIIQTKLNLLISIKHKAINKASYDTELEGEDDEVYNNLHDCCQYTRG